MGGGYSNTRGDAIDKGLRQYVMNDKKIILANRQITGRSCHICGSKHAVSRSNLPPLAVGEDRAISLLSSCGREQWKSVALERIAVWEHQ
jgi:hypothetical protein